MTESSTSWTVLARLLRPQGRKGEVLAELLTDFPEQFTERTRVLLGPAGFGGEATAARSMEVSSYWLPVGKNEGRIVLKFAGIDSISDAETVVGLDVMVPREERVALEDGAIYIDELVGCTLYDGPTAIGVVSDVQFAMTPDGARRMAEAAPLLAVTSEDGNEVLVPFAKAFLVGVDVADRRVNMVLPEGLIEVNRSHRSSREKSDQKR